MFHEEGDGFDTVCVEEHFVQETPQGTSDTSAVSVNSFRQRIKTSVFSA